MLKPRDRTWVVVADASRARILGNHPERNRLTEIEDFLNPEARLHEQELTSDLPGRGRNPSGAHGVEEGNGKKAASANGLAEDIAARLDRARSQGEFEKLYLIAPPRFLGRLRDKLSAPTRRLISDTVDKELTRSSAEAIRKELPRKL